MGSTINKLFEFYDKIFIEERVEIDSFGNYGAHYIALNFDRYLEESVLGIDYLSIEDYFETMANVSYQESQSLFQQYSEQNIDVKLKIISAILTLIKISTYKVEEKDMIIHKSQSFLGRYGLELQFKDDRIQIKNEYKLFEGSYCDVLFYNKFLYKKQLKNHYRSNEDWKKRFKYEYENMFNLSESPFILKVFHYDYSEDSYLMEKCDCNLDDYIKKNPFVDDEKILDIINEILLAMKDVHNAGIIHRDLHLGNILIKNQHVVLCDFGLSKNTMIEHSLKSTDSPKNSHYFMDPIGFSSFTKLDKLSDIYSIGKIIDYITKDSQLNTNLSYVINKATDRDRKKRYNDLDEMIKDIASQIQKVTNEEKIIEIEKKIN